MWIPDVWVKTFAITISWWCVNSLHLFPVQVVNEEYYLASDSLATSIEERYIVALRITS